MYFNLFKNRNTFYNFCVGIFIHVILKLNKCFSDIMTFMQHLILIFS